MYMNVNPSKLMKEVLSMLYWSMLAACTVGPGTVVTCARAGAEFEMSLIYVLIFASVLAYTLQEGTARLTINSGLSLGQCLRRKYEHTVKLYNTALICWVVAICVTIGNTLYECNNWAGGIDAVMSMPGTAGLDTEEDFGILTGIRVGSCLAYASVVIALLYKDKTNVLGVFLGVIMMGMVILFLTVVCIMGIDWTKLAWGLLPNYPAKTEAGREPADIIISLVGTTSIGFNLFLGGAMARGRSLGSAQRGIAFSTVSAFVVSALILIVGAGFHEVPDRDPNFSITQLGAFIKEFVGTTGVTIYSLGFISAALSSMLTVPLGAALTADSVFSDDTNNDKNDADAEGEVDNEADNDKYAISSDKIPVPTSPSKVPMSPTKSVTSEKISMPASPVSSTPASPAHDNQSFVNDNNAVIRPSSSQPSELGLTLETQTKDPQKLPRWIYLSIMFGMVIIATVVISANADRTYVILVAQVFNGCLLPFFSTCLLLCLNDQQFMKTSPQPLWANIFLVVSVIITMFLANNVILSKLFGSVLEANLEQHSIAPVRLGIAFGAALVEITFVAALTSLGKDVWRSFRQSKVSSLCGFRQLVAESSQENEMKFSKV